MITKKQSTKKAATGKAETNAAERDLKELDALALHLSAALRILQTSEVIPTRVYNHFAEGWNDIMNLVNDDDHLHSEEHVRLYLRALAKKGGAR